MGENSPSNHHNENNRSHNILTQAEQEAMDFYLEGGSRKSPRGYQGPERRSPFSRADRVIRQIDNLVPTLIGMKYTSSGSAEKDMALREFQNWFPSSLQEAQTVINGAMRRVNNAANTRTGSPESAIADRYYTFSGYLLDSAEDIHSLNQGMSAAETDTSNPDPEMIRTSHTVLGTIAKQLLAREFVHNNHWYSQHTNMYKERFKYWFGFTLATSKFANDESMLQMYDFARTGAEKRFKYWQTEKQLVEKMPVVQNLIAQGKIVPVSFNRLLHKRASEIAAQESQMTIEDVKEYSLPTDWDALISPGAREMIEEQRRKDEERVEDANAEYDREYEKLAGMFSHPQVREKLAQRGIGRASLASEIKDQEDEAELREIAERANQPKTPPKKKKRFKRRWRESGPSDKRVEKDHY